jgi:putative ABC transport system permease protein
MWLIVRSDRGAAFTFEQVKAALRTIDPELPLVDATPVVDLLDRSVAARRFNLFLLTALAVLALVVAAVGVAGLVGFAVNRGRQEVGIRMALGAGAPSVIRTTVAPTLRAFVAGIAIGLLASAFLVRLLRGLLFGIRPLDGWSMLLACGALLLAATLAALVPALRAVRIDPLAALRAG